VRDDHHARVAALKRIRFPVEPQSALVLFRAVTGITAVGEDGFDLAIKVGGCMKRGGGTGKKHEREPSN
jgi:hypothetical protein